MLELVFAACSIVSGASCRDFTLTFDQDAGQISAFACAFNGQVELSKWQSEHPNWRIARFTCRQAGLFAKG